MDRFGVNIEVGLVEKDFGVDVPGLRIFGELGSEAGQVCSMLTDAMHDTKQEVNFAVRNGIITLVHRCTAYSIIPYTIEMARIVEQIETHREINIRPLDENLLKGFMITA